MKFLKTASAALAAFMTVPMVVSAESSENTITAEGIEFLIHEDGTAAVVGIADKESVEVVIPEQVEGHAVTTLGAESGIRVFEGCERMKSVSIPASVMCVWDKCFDGVEGLEDVYYAGTGEQWRKITVGTLNDSLFNAKFHFDAGEPDIPDIPDLVNRGDANEDGKVNARDVTAVLKHAAGIEMLSGEGFANADADFNGVINAADATIILKIIAGIIAE